MGHLVRLQSQNLQVDVLPENGGRIASIRCRRTGTEFLLEGSTYGATAAFSPNARFEQSDCAGWDECLPTVSLSPSDSMELDAADHGDLWRGPWSILEQTDDRITLSTECFSRPLIFTRSLHLEATRLRLNYSIVNRGQRPTPFLYACHPLFAVEAGDRVLLPPEVDAVILNFSRGDRLGRPGEQLSWPRLGPDSADNSIDCAGDISEGTAEMFYTASLERGVCALYRSRLQQSVLMHFSHTNIPFLGIWMCNGGWPEGPGLRKQYAIALEPTVAPFGSLAEAVRANAAPILQSGEDFKFSIEVEILGCEQPCTFEEVRAKVK